MVADREYSEGKEKEKIMLVREIRAGFSSGLRYPNVQCLNVDSYIPVGVSGDRVSGAGEGFGSAQQNTRVISGFSSDANCSERLWRALTQRIPLFK